MKKADSGKYSIEELSGERWKFDGDFPSSLISRCYEYRKVPLNQLSADHLRLLVSQGIGLEYVMPFVLVQLKENPIVEGSYYPGDLLLAVGTVDSGYWKKNPGQLQIIISIVQNQSTAISKELSSNRVEQILTKLQEFSSND
ncbi:hypothetical protein GGR28_003442 [Lewinella aquimaris]|uniref:Uncharacterized protein n=1 Tax=Neolewinella aquimaris TaxID=1835722 RepID=A0A840EBI3_9BACT|nr:contact-dependent growth inhibition system immunity protein [Neolewinella aquimaris]MBB4080807.1 hypothetical protein [Neolewinella aquimaris]